MDKDLIAGVAHQIKGGVKEIVGKATGGAKTQAEGAAEKAAGKVQNAVGGAKDAIRGNRKEVIPNPCGGKRCRRRAPMMRLPTGGVFPCPNCSGLPYRTTSRGRRRLQVFITIDHQACRYNLTGNSWTGTYLAWVTFDDVTVGAEKEPASGL
jgi:uncharacterized protein YjbJ (UPF0337 family)